jgi:hypothetical protein
MDQLQTRLDALEQRTHTVERQLRWWRGLAGGLLVLAVLTWALPVVTADDPKPDDDDKNLEQRVAALEQLLKHFSREDNEVFITGANLHIVNGLGDTNCFDEQFAEIPDCPNGLGNLIVGYNESRAVSGGEDIRTGSHNVVVGEQHNFSSSGGLVVGSTNTISGDFAVVSGGASNTASGPGATVSGGQNNLAASFGATVSGGQFNAASGDGIAATVSGGDNNIANGNAATVSGGATRTAAGEFDWVAGSLVEDQ